MSLQRAQHLQRPRGWRDFRKQATSCLQWAIWSGLGLQRGLQPGPWGRVLHPLSPAGCRPLASGAASAEPSSPRPRGGRSACRGV